MSHQLQMFMYDAKLLARLNLRYLVLDEGHRIKNCRCVLLKRLRLLSGNCSRLLMTGTPLQNDLSELWSLLNFLLPEIFTDLDWFQSFFALPSLFGVGSGEEAARKQSETLAKLHQIIKPFLLRRIKTDVEVELPAKTEIWLYAPLTTHQMAMYKAAVEKSLLKFCGIDKGVIELLSFIVW